MIFLKYVIYKLYTYKFKFTETNSSIIVPAKPGLQGAPVHLRYTKPVDQEQIDATEGTEDASSPSDGGPAAMAAGIGT